MTDINHQQLRELWIKRRDKYRSWEKDIVAGAYELRSKIAEKLVAPENWTDPKTNETHRYIELIILDTKLKPKTDNELTELISNLGELPFGISVALDYKESSFPKTLLHAPVSIRYLNNEMQYAWWDTENEMVEAQSNWSGEIDKFVAEILRKIEENLSHSPYSGFDTKTKIGFI